LFGHKFRRQDPICGYVVDFVCREAKVIIEVDGAYHAQRMEQDRARADALEAGGYVVLRFANADVVTGVGRVLESIGRTLVARSETLPGAQFPSPGASRRPLP
jgi:very-short-patch-repair endonuclease